tara:strand:- start:1486 stop:2289 length:804 start_codon:yes stop_codon:yes gene_type:complete
MKKLLLIILFLNSCSSLDIDKRFNTIDELNNTEFKEYIFDNKSLRIYSLQKVSNNKSLVLYIEGDGLSWIDRFTISSNPTPTDPIAFKLALIDKGDNIIYLARPCQYIWSDTCNQDLWTTSQYSKVVLETYEEVLTELSTRYTEIHIVGYSGGAGIAMYLGTTNNPKIKSIRTVAGNINHNELSKIIKISPLRKSINFYPLEKKANKIPQIHYYGNKDKVIPNELQQRFYLRNKENSCIKIKQAKASHNKGWLNFWINNYNIKVDCS